MTRLLELLEQIVEAAAQNASGCTASEQATQAVFDYVANVAAGIISFLSAHYTNADYKAIINNSGNVPIQNTAAQSFVTKILNTFLSNGLGYNLNVGNTTTCAGLPGR